MPPCPSCGEALASPLVCEACHSLHPAPEDLDPFAVFGLEPAYVVDAGALKKRLLRLQRAMHPDFFGGSDEATRDLAVRNTSELNAAHDTLRDDRVRADHLVRHLGGPDENEERQMPQAFLMEVMEWNETLEEARESAPGSDERAAALALGRDLREERAKLFDSIAALLTPLPDAGSDRLTEVRRQLNAVRYLDRALGQIEEIRLEGARAPS